ncbi:MAG: hypothetical protein A4E71_01896 [Smithella sp. PtaU1.Bin162]|nr:MAG: hypothetical protein A4E71_01896 [Smithella sp. PtaU1.Bin162]
MTQSPINQLTVFNKETVHPAIAVFRVVHRRYTDDILRVAESEERR